MGGGGGAGGLFLVMDAEQPLGVEHGGRGHLQIQASQPCQEAQLQAGRSQALRPGSQEAGRGHSAAPTS